MSYNPQNPNGQATSANSEPVVVASDQSAIPVSGTITANAGTNLNTSALSTSANQTNASQKTQVVDGSGNVIGSTSNALNVNISGGSVSGSSNIAQVGGTNVVTAGVGGTLATGGNQAAGSNISSNTNPLVIGGSDYGGTAKLQSLKVDSSGNAQVAVTNTPSVTISGTPTITANAGTNLNTSALALDTSVNGLLVSQGSTTSGQKGTLTQGAVTTSTPTYTTGQTSPLSLDTSGNLRTSVNNTVTVSGTVTTTPPSNASTNIAQIGGSAVALGNTTMSGSLPVTLASNDTNTAPFVASGGGGYIRQDSTGTIAKESGGNLATIAGAVSSAKMNVQGSATAATAPAFAIEDGGVASTSLPTATSNGQLTGLMVDKFGRMVTVPQSTRDIVGQQSTTITASTASTAVVTGISNVFADISSIVLANSGTSATLVTLSDGTNSYYFYVPAGDTRGATYQVPLPATTVATNWTATCGTSTSSLYVTVEFIKNR